MFLSRKRTGIFNDGCCVAEALDTNTIQLDGAGLWTSKVSLKALLLHNGNKFPSVPLANAAEMKVL